MKQIKKNFALALLLLTGIVSAQNQGIEGGYVSSQTNNNDAVTGIQIGPVAESTLFGPLRFQYGIKYQLLYQYTEHSLGKSTYTGHFVEVPLRLNVSFALTNDFTIFAFAGPNIDFGLEEKIVTLTPVFGSEVKTTIHQYKIDSDDNNQPDYSRFNLQAGIGGGIHYHNLRVKAGYDWGLNDLYLPSDGVSKRNQLTLSLGFLL